jgi:hypothetical protein
MNKILLIILIILLLFYIHNRMYHLFIFNWCVILYKIIVSENFREKFIKKIVIKLYYSYTTLNKEIGYVLIDEVHSIFDKYKVR